MSQRARPLSILAMILGGATAHADPAPVIAPEVAALVAKVDAVAQEVSQQRGLPVTAKIASDVVDRAELRARLVKLVDEPKAKAQTRAEGRALARWGLVPRDVDFEALMIGVLDEQIAGYYDPKTKKMTFVSASVQTDPTWAEMVLAHELDHALQDQRFDLQKYEDLPDDEGDASIARHAVVEGDGVALMIEVLLARNGAPAPWGNPLIATLITNEMVVPNNGDTLARAPLVVQEQMIFPYRAGFAFVAALRKDHPWASVDAAFARPPRSTEQILHPERYVRDEPPVKVAAPIPPTLARAGYAQIHATVWGELGFATFLRTHGVADPAAAEAADGWGGDRAIVLARRGVDDPRRSIGIVRSVWDTEAEAIEAAGALAHALDDLAIGATVHHDDARTTWLALDGTVTWIERRGTAIAIATGVPAWAATAVAHEL